MSPHNHSNEITNKISFMRYGVIVVFFWSLLIVFSLLWAHRQYHNKALELGKGQGRAFFEKDVLYRRWASRHGGVYVPVSDSTLPNPYLSHIPERDITTPSGRQLTLVNPAYMTRQVFELANEYKGTGRGHITSLKPIRAANAPDSWEKEVLLAFERGVPEVGQIELIDGKSYYRYMKSLIVDTPCLKCHQIQGYREGDVRGGLSVSVDMEPIYALMANEMQGVYINHALIWFMGIGLIGFGTRKIHQKTLSLYEKTVELEHEIKARQKAQEDLQEKSIMLEDEIAERQKLEEANLVIERQYQQAQKLESLGVLAGGIAHDFNNILAIIIGYCSLIKLDYESVENSVIEIETAAERAAGLCRQMLAYAGKTQFIQSEVNIVILVNDMVKMLKTTISQNAVIKLDIPTDIPFIMADASQISQIVMNLTLNAAEAIGEAQGEILISLAKKEIKAGQSEQDHFGNTIKPNWYVCLEVTDNGCGMDENTQQRIFEPFYTTKFAGRGLGMSAVLGIINAHDGAMQISSKSGEGTTFKVYLPVRNDNLIGDDSFADSVPEVAWCGSGTILLVEDDVKVKLVAKAMLIKLGFTVIEASNGREALELYEKNNDKISLVLTDMGMPVMDGYALFCELKKLDPDLPIIFSSGFGDSVVLSKIPQEDLAGLISKPYSFYQLRDALKTVMAT